MAMVPSKSLSLSKKALEKWLEDFDAGGLSHAPRQIVACLLVMCNVRCSWRRFSLNKQVLLASAAC